jgi:putative Holliday junction resolvase
MRAFIKAYFCRMGRILAIDYGSKRCGIALSDPLAMIANGLPTTETFALLDRLKALHADPGFEVIVVGLPLRHSGEPSSIESHIQQAITKMKEAFPEVVIERFDERFTSKIAMQTMIAAGATKKQRREKGNIDKVSATLLLQEYLNKR